MKKKGTILITIIALFVITNFLSCSEDSYGDAPYGVAAVDLGLSVKWATCNIGATLPEEPGEYFAWGETLPKQNYTWETYEYCDSDKMELATNIGRHATFTISDGKHQTYDISGTEYDVAHVNWGGKWRMPTATEILELVGSCKWEYTTINGTTGYKVVGHNGNAIFLPLASHKGHRFLGSSYFSLYGCYWSSTMDWGPFETFKFHSSTAYSIQFGFKPYDLGYQEATLWDGMDRSLGFSVRAVQ